MSITRREFGVAALAIPAALPFGFGARTAARAAETDRYQALHTDHYVGAVETVAEVKDDQVFTEGPAVAPDGSVFFTNVPAEKIYRWDAKSGKLEVFRESSNKANGLLFDGEGRLLACEGGAARVTRTNLKAGKAEKTVVIAEGFDGKSLAAPNDLVLTKSGQLFFSSRPATDQSNVNAVYRVDRDKSIHQVLKSPEIHMPNGMGISPDGKTYYLIEAHPDADHHRDIRAYDLSPAGELSNERIVTNFYPGRSGDGMCVSRKGLLCVAAGLHALRKTSETLDTRPGIHIISPAGRWLGWRETPEDTLTNCTLDEKRGWLYATCRGRLLRMKWNDKTA